MSDPAAPLIPPSGGCWRIEAGRLVPDSPTPDVPAPEPAPADPADEPHQE